MQWRGRIIGTIIGFFFSPLGMLVGFLIGYFFFDKPANQRKLDDIAARNTFMGSSNTYNPNHPIIIEITFALMGYIARGAGVINQYHIDQAERFMNEMNLSAEVRDRAITAFSEGKSENFALEATIRRLQSTVGTNASMVSLILEILVSTAIADEELSQGEHERLLRVASYLHVPIQSMERLIRIRIAEQQFRRFAEQFSQQNQGNYYRGQSYDQYQQYGYDQFEKEQEQSRYKAPQASKQDLERAYTILGVGPDSSWDEIRKAHKKLMLKYHPDRLASQGLPPEMIKIYTQKAQDIQAAFAVIKSAHGK